jgi:hypothetical protein
MDSALGPGMILVIGLVVLVVIGLGLMSRR